MNQSPSRRWWKSFVSLAVAAATVGCPATGDPVQRAPILYPHLEAFVRDSAHELDYVVFLELALALVGDRLDPDSLAIDGTEPSRAAVAQQLSSSLERLRVDFESRGIGNLRERVRAAGFDPDLNDPALVSAIVVTAGSSQGPEHHDSQRLIREVNGALAYVSHELTVFAHEKVKTWGDGKYRQAKARRVAYVRAAAGGNHGGYEPLAIPASGNQCLYLRESAGTWRAYFVADANPSTCLPEIAPPDTGLPVYRRTVVDLQRNPGVARWEWSVARSVHSIGIKCGSAWCQIHNSRIDPSELEAPAGEESGTDADDSAFARVVGWQDLQPLAVPDADSLIPRGPLGRVIPRGLKKFHRNSGDGSFYSVAKVVLDGDYPQLGMRKGENVLAVCNHATDCADASGFPDSLKGQCVAAKSGDGRPWFVRIINGADSTFRCLRFVYDGGSTDESRFSTRWTFAKSDELMWIRCPGGCCQMY